MNRNSEANQGVSENLSHSLPYISVESKSRQNVVEKKYELWNNFKLDLSYITPSLIVMASPTTQPGGNDAKVIKQYLEYKHPSQFKLHDLNSVYPSGSRNKANELGQPVVLHRPIEKRFVLPFKSLLRTLESIQQFLNLALGQVAVLHSDAGLGRCGFIVASYLVFSEKMTAQQAINTFRFNRTVSNSPGPLLSPLQIQYVRYLEAFLTYSRRCPFNPAPMVSGTLVSVTLNCPPPVNNMRPWIVASSFDGAIICNTIQRYTAKKSLFAKETPIPLYEKAGFVIPIEVVISGDVLLSVYTNKGQPSCLTLGFNSQFFPLIDQSSKRANASNSLVIPFTKMALDGTWCHDAAINADISLSVEFKIDSKIDSCPELHTRDFISPLVWEPRPGSSHRGGLGHAQERNPMPLSLSTAADKAAPKAMALKASQQHLSAVVDMDEAVPAAEINRARSESLVGL
jgi:hypothetical protein